MASLTKGPTVGDLLKFDLDKNYTHEEVWLVSGVSYPLGAVLGEVSNGGGAAAAAQTGGNTGTGTLIVDVSTPVLAGAKAGVYALKFITATTFTLTDPKGDIIGTYAIGGSNGNKVTVANEVKFELEQASTVFVVGDGFDITVATGSATSAAKGGGNTGNGTAVLSALAPVADGAQPGVYALRFTALTAFSITNPNGDVIGEYTIGGSNGNSALVAAGVNATITQGGTAFAIGDGFDFTVVSGPGLYALSPNAFAAATPGAEIVGGVLLDAVDATSEPKRGVVIKRGPAIVSRDALVFHASVDDADKRAAKIAQLTELGIVTRATA